MPSVKYLVVPGDLLPVPYVYISSSEEIDNPNVQIKPFIKEINIDVNLSIDDTVFVIFDNIKREIINMYLQEEFIPQAKSQNKNYYIYSTNVKDNIYDYPLQ